MEEGDAEIALRKYLFHLRSQDYRSARKAYESTNGTIAHQTCLTFSAFVEMLEGVLSIEQMRKKHQRLLSVRNRNELGIVAHFDWAIARLLGLRELPKQKGHDFYDLTYRLDFDAAAEFRPIASLMIGEDDDPLEGLLKRSQRNRVLAETYFLVDIDLLADGKRAEAKNLFQHCIDCGRYNLWVHSWSRRFIELVDDAKHFSWLESAQNVPEPR